VAAARAFPRLGQGSPLPPRIGEARHGNGGFFMRRRLGGVETGGRLSHDGGARSKKSAWKPFDEKGQSRRVGLTAVKRNLQSLQVLLYYFQL